MAGDTASVMGQAPPDIPTQQSDSPQNQIPQIPQMPPTQAAAPAQAPNPGVIDTLHHSVWGRAAKFLLGNQTTYRVNPQTGQTEEVQVPQKPGQMMRSLVAGAILGGAAGTENAGRGGFMGGFSAGGAAVQAKADQNALQAKADAQRQYDNQLKSAKDQRESATQQQKLVESKARVEHLNTLNAGQAFLNSRALVTAKNEDASVGTATLKPFRDAGVKLAYDSIPEDKMQEIIAKTPVGKYLWEPTGTRISVDKDGHPFAAMEYSAIALDKDQSLQLTSGVIDNFKKAGMDTSNLKAGQPLTATDYMNLQGQYKTLHNQQEIEAKQKRDAGHEDAETSELKARAANYLAATVREKRDERKANDLDDATKAYGQAGYNWDKLGEAVAIDKKTKQPYPIGQEYQRRIWEANNDKIKVLTDELKAVVDADPDPHNPQAMSLLQQLDMMNSLMPKAFKAAMPTAGGALPKPPTPGAKLPDDIAMKYVTANGGDKTKARAAAKQDGWDIGDAKPGLAEEISVLPGYVTSGEFKKDIQKLTHTKEPI